MKNNNRVCILPNSADVDPSVGCERFPPHGHVSGRGAKKMISDGDAEELQGGTKPVLQRCPYKSSSDAGRWDYVQSSRYGPIVVEMK